MTYFVGIFFEAFVSLRFVLKFKYFILFYLMWMSVVFLFCCCRSRCVLAPLIQMNFINICSITLKTFRQDQQMNEFQTNDLWFKIQHFTSDLNSIHFIFIYGNHNVSTKFNASNETMRFYCDDKWLPIFTVHCFVHDANCQMIWSHYLKKYVFLIDVHWNASISFHSSGYVSQYIKAIVEYCTYFSKK